MNRIEDRRSEFSRGYTLVETLVAVGVIAILCAILLPAIQAAREASRRATCLNNLRQLSIALQSYAGRHALYPSASGLPPTASTGSRLYSAYTQLLPDIERSAEFHSINFSVRLVDSLDMPFSRPGYEAIAPANETVFKVSIGTLLCPTDSIAPGYLGAAGVNYRANIGATPVNRDSSIHLYGPFSDLRTRITMGSVRDGLSNTAAFSERLRGRGNGFPLDTRRDILIARSRFGLDSEIALDECPMQSPLHVRYQSIVGASWALGTPLHTTYNHHRTPNSNIPDCGIGYMMPMRGRVGPRSGHGGAVGLAMCDGSSRMVANSIGPNVWLALGTIGGGEPIQWND